MAQIRSTLLHRIPYSMVWNNTIFQKKNEWFFIFNTSFSKLLLKNFLNYSQIIDKNCWNWRDDYFLYLKNTHNYNFSLFNNRLYFFYNENKNVILKNSNKSSNTSIQGKINFFDINDNLYCLNSYYLQNFLKIKNKKKTYKKKKNILKYKKFKIFKNKKLNFFKKCRNIPENYNFFKIKNYKNFIKTFFFENYFNNYTFFKFNNSNFFTFINHNFTKNESYSLLFNAFLIPDFVSKNYLIYNDLNFNTYKEYFYNFNNIFLQFSNNFFYSVFINENVKDFKKLAILDDKKLEAKPKPNFVFYKKFYETYKNDLNTENDDNFFVENSFTKVVNNLYTEKDDYKPLKQKFFKNVFKTFQFKTFYFIHNKKNDKNFKEMSELTLFFNKNFDLGFKKYLFNKIENNEDLIELFYEIFSYLPNKILFDKFIKQNFFIFVFSLYASLDINTSLLEELEFMQLLSIKNKKLYKDLLKIFYELKKFNSELNLDDDLKEDLNFIYTKEIESILTLDVIKLLNEEVLSVLNNNSFDNVYSTNDNEFDYENIGLIEDYLYDDKNKSNKIDYNKIFDNSDDFNYDLKPIENKKFDNIEYLINVNEINDKKIDDVVNNNHIDNPQIVEIKNIVNGENIVHDTNDIDNSVFLNTEFVNNNENLDNQIIIQEEIIQTYNDWLLYNENCVNNEIILDFELTTFRCFVKYKNYYFYD